MSDNSLVEKITIRIAIPDDRDAIELLTRLLVSERKEYFDPKRFEWGMVRRLMDPFQRQGIYLAEVEEGIEKVKKVVGMIFSELRVDPFGYSEGYIKQFFVRPKYRKHGIGKALVQAEIDHLKSINVAIIKVNVKNGSDEAFKLYSNQNFQLKHIVMELKLKIDDNNADLDAASEFDFESDKIDSKNEE